MFGAGIFYIFDFSHKGKTPRNSNAQIKLTMRIYSYTTRFLVLVSLTVLLACNKTITNVNSQSCAAQSGE